MGEQEREIRVTDKRRVYLDEDDDTKTSVDEPSLKPKYVEELEARTKAAEQLVQELQSRFEQIRAELQKETDETRRRLNRAADERAQQEKANFLASLLPVLDNLERAITAVEEGGSLDSMLEGLNQTVSTFEQALVAAKVEPITAVGELFDPELHEAVEIAEVEPEMDGKIVAEYARGFRMGDRLIRPARVKVGRGMEIKKAFQES